VDAMKKFLSYTVLILCLISLVWVSLPASVQARVDQVFQSVKFEGKVLVNLRKAALSDDDGYSYMMEINDYGTSGVSTDTGQGKMAGTTAAKTYALGIDVSRPSTAVATGDSNDAVIRGSYKNYAVNTSLAVRGVNINAHNRVGGTVTSLDNILGAANRGICPTIKALSLRAENYGTTATEFGGIDLELSNEGAAATTEYGLRIRNTNNSIASAVDHAIQITDTGANTGFTNGIAIGTSIVQSQITFSNGAKLFVGACNGENAVYAEVGAYDAVGSIYLSSIGKIYVQVADAGATSDWELVTSASGE
jgi:hypothetical protein